MKQAISQNYRLVLTIGVLQSFFYYAINHHPIFQPTQLPLTYFDNMIPLLPWTVWPYLGLLFSNMVLILVIRDRDVFAKTAVVYSLTLSLNFLAFVFFPTTYPRWDFHTTDQLNPALSLLFLLDSPNNCFPSAHITGSAIAWWGFGMDRPKLRPGLAVTFTLLSLTILTTKQHYVWDLLGGVFMAGTMIYCSSGILEKFYAMQKVLRKIKKGGEIPA